MTFSKLGTDTGQLVYLPKTARTQGLYIIGIQGTGKSGLIENLIMQDIDQQIGVCVLDPHGELIDQVIARLEPKNEKDVVLLDLTNYSYPFGLNLFECPDPTDDGEIVKTLYQVLHVFEKAYGIVPTTPLMYDLLYNAVYTLIANPGYTMIDIRLLLTNEACRKKLVANVPNPDVYDFWSIWDDPKQTTPQERENKRGTILNKMNEFSHVPLRNIVGQSKTTFSLQGIMDTGKILLVKLSRRLEQPSNLIGSIIIAQLLNSAYARPVNKRKQFHLYADEFQNFATEDFATLLEEARKFGIGTTIAHQNRSQLNSANNQLETNLKDRSRSVGSLVVFKINSKDADDLAGEFDTTPPPPQPEEKTRRAIQTPRSDAIDWLLSGKTHGNPIVNRFINKWNMREVKRTDNPINGERFLDKLNALCFGAMEYKNPDVLPINLLCLQQVLTYESVLFGSYVHGRQFSETLPMSVPNNILQHMTLANLIFILSDPAWGRIIDRTIHRVRLLENLEAVFHRGIYYSEYAASEIQHELSRFFQDEPYTNMGWFRIDGNNLLWEEKAYQTSLKEGQEINWYTPQSLEWEIDRIMASPQGVIQVRPMLLRFFSDLRAMLWVLVNERIEDDSGQQEIVMGHGIQLSSAETAARISNQLSGLPPFTARVKIGVNATQNPGKTCLNCGLQHGSIQHSSGDLFCAGCNTKLPAPNEYTITTIKPTGHIGTQQFDQRMKRIQAKNVQDVYTRPRKDVEAEITQQQQGCSGGSAPAYSQQSQQSPHARKVPTCQTCGKSNPPGSIFCNKCGAKLT